MSAYSMASRTRPVSMSGVPALNPLDVLDLADRLQWPGEPDECLHVISAMDDTWREMAASAPQE